MKKLKNVLIILLVFSALWQTEQLWFEEFSNRNFFFFSNSFPTVNLNTSTDYSGLVDPYRIILNQGNNTYHILYNDLTGSNIKRQADSILRQAMKNSQHETSSSIDWPSLLQNRSLIFEYTFSMPIEAFIGGHGFKSSHFSARVKNFQALVITPNGNSQQQIQLSFLDLEEDLCVQFTLDTRQMSESLYTEIGKNVETDLYYISSVESGFPYFEGNVFIPQWTGQNLKYPVVKAVNPYGELMMGTVGKKVEVFFNNPSGFWTDFASGVYTYGDEYVVVKYYPNHVLEYSNYDIKTATGSYSLLQDYAAAALFMARDDLITNEYYLSDILQEDGRTTFYFDYSINHAPLILSERMRVQLEMSHPIEITVQNQTVVKYKKLTYNFELEEDLTEVPTIDFIHSLNSIIALNTQSAEDYEQAISQVTLGYIIEPQSNDSTNLSEFLFYNWCYVIQGQIMNISAQQKQTDWGHSG